MSSENCWSEPLPHAFFLVVLSTAHRSVRNGHTEFSRELIARGAGINWRDSDGQTPLYWAIAHGETELVRVLVQHKADTNAGDKDKCTPLHLAAALNKPHLIEPLVEAGARYSALRSKGRTRCLRFHALLGAPHRIQCVGERRHAADSAGCGVFLWEFCSRADARQLWEQREQPGQGREDLSLLGSASVSAVASPACMQSTKPPELS